MQFNAPHHRPLSAEVQLRTDVRRIILTDEAVSVEFTLVGLEPRTVSAVALQELTPSGWVDHARFGRRRSNLPAASACDCKRVPRLSDVGSRRWTTAPSRRSRHPFRSQKA